MRHEFMDFDYEDIYETKLERLKYLLHNKIVTLAELEEFINYFKENVNIYSDECTRVIWRCNLEMTCDFIASQKTDVIDVEKIKKLKREIS